MGAFFSVPLEQSKKIQDDYNKRFAEVEHRAFRAMHMNYEESSYFDKWSRRAETMSYVLGTAGLVGGVGLVSFRIPNGLPLAIIVLPLTGLLQYAANGQSEGLPSLALRAQKHVEAGAGWMKLHRQANLYRTELNATPPGSIREDEQHKRYMELLDGYKEASICTVIRREAYYKHTNFAYTEREYKRRILNLHKYLQLHDEVKNLQKADLKKIEDDLKESKKREEEENEKKMLRRFEMFRELALF